MIRLKDILIERKVLSVFDFDDTIAKSDAWIYVTRGRRVIKKLDPAQFATYRARPGEDFDFREFDRKIQNPRLIKRNADLLRKQLDKARRAARGTRKVTILTARKLGQPITSFLKSIGIDAYVVPLGGADPQLKADWIEAQIKKGYDTVYFMDDSNKNIAAVNNMLKRYPNVKSITKLIKEDIDLTPKKTWKDVNIKDMNPEVAKTVFTMYKTTYDAEGMDLSAYSTQELMSTYQAIFLIDIDEDASPDAFIIYRKEAGSNRIKLLATDGERLSKKLVILKVLKLVRTPGWTLEASKRMEDLMKSSNAPYIDDEEMVRKMVGPKFGKWLGDGYYERKLSKISKMIVKRMYGKV